MMRFHFGVGGKLNLALGAVLLAVTAAFGVSYAFIERDVVLDIEREHLTHMGSLARLYLADARDRSELEIAVREFNEKLASSRGAPHRLVVEDERGMALATSSFGNALPSRDAAPLSPGQPSSVELDPSALRVELPFTLERYEPSLGSRQPARIVLIETVPDIERMFHTSLIRHLGFGASLVGLAMLAAGLATHVLVVRPVRDLVSATDEIARDGLWGPFTPSDRRQDEIGALQDHLASMSRRLIEAVRVERYGSVHLIVGRVHREVEGPLRRARMHLTVLEDLLRNDSEAARARAEVASELDSVAAIVRGLEQLPSRPVVD